MFGLASFMLLISKDLLDFVDDVSHMAGDGCVLVQAVIGEIILRADFVCTTG